MSAGFRQQQTTNKDTRATAVVQEQTVYNDIQVHGYRLPGMLGWESKPRERARLVFFFCVNSFDDHVDDIGSSMVNE